MELEPANLSEWRELARASPEAVVSRYFSRLSALPEKEAKALLASVPEPADLAGSLPEPALPGEDQSPLSGLPFLLQDLFDVQGWPTACGAQLDEILDQPAEVSSILCRELERRGAWFGGKVVPSEFGLDLRGRGRVFAPQSGRACGGGGGTCAEAVAGGLAPVAFGLDTAGGLRVPAAFNGVFAYRMAHNRLARDGVFPVAPSLDAIGWVTKESADMGEVIRTMYDLPAEELEADYRGCFLSGFVGGMEPELKAEAMAMVRELALDEEPSLRSRLLPAFREAGKALTVLVGRELYSVHRYWIEEYRDRYDPEVLRILRRGMDHGLTGADGATRIRDSVVAAFSELFESYDFLVLPTTRIPSPSVSEWSARIEADVHGLLAPVSLAGLPALQLPVRCPNGRSGGLQVVFNPRDKRIALSVLASVEGFYADEV